MPTARFFSRLFIYFFIIYLFIFSFICPQTFADLKEQLQKPDSGGIHLGIITLYHPLVMYRNYQPFADYLSANTPYYFSLKVL